jgi:hypothetical protein
VQPDWRGNDGRGEAAVRVILAEDSALLREWLARLLGAFPQPREISTAGRNPASGDDAPDRCLSVGTGPLVHCLTPELVGTLPRLPNTWS